MKTTLVYYGHRFRDADPETQRRNLCRAIDRFADLEIAGLARGIVYHAPWIALAMSLASR